jgi:hypothetical protein
MSFVSVNPEAFGSAAQDLTGIGSAIRSANTAAAASTTQVAAAAQDEVSTAIAGVFGSVGQQYQALIGQAEQFHEQFVQALTSSAGTYAATEAANASRLRTFAQYLVKQYEQVNATLQMENANLQMAAANVQMALAAYDNNPTQANLAALQSADTALQSAQTALQITITLYSQDLQTYQSLVEGLAQAVRVWLGAAGLA